MVHNKRQRRKKNYQAPALEKGLDILELLAIERDPLSITAIASRLERSTSEIFRMVVVLEQRGYVRKADDERYTLTLMLFRLATRDRQIQRLTSAAVLPMRIFCESTNQSCHLSIYSRGRAVVIAQESAPIDRQFTVRLGAEAPLVGSCSGHLMLAFSDSDSRRELLNLQSRRDRQQTKKSTLTQKLDAIRKRGYESLESPQVSGIHDIGYPIFDHRGLMIAALVAPYFEQQDRPHHIGMDECRSSLANAASAISRQLGFQSTLNGTQDHYVGEIADDQG